MRRRTAHISSSPSSATFPGGGGTPSRQQFLLGGERETHREMTAVREPRSVDVRVEFESKLLKSETRTSQLRLKSPHQALSSYGTAAFNLRSPTEDAGFNSAPVSESKRWWSCPPAPTAPPRCSAAGCI
jgi:hypothetical protein